MGLTDVPALDYAHLPPFWQWVLLIGAILTALAILYGFGRRLWKALGVIARLTAAAPALMDLPQFMITTAHTLADQDEKIKEIHHEVQFNNGSSVKDAVTRVETVLTENTKKLSTQIAAQRRIEKGVKGLYDRVDQNEADAAVDRKNIAAAQKELEDTRPVVKRRTYKPKEQ